jgi:hypothetical protein
MAGLAHISKEISSRAAKVLSARIPASADLMGRIVYCITGLISGFVYQMARILRCVINFLAGLFGGAFLFTTTGKARHAHEKGRAQDRVDAGS